MPVRRLLFWAHLVTAVAVGLVILLLAGTGLLLTYERQIVGWAEARAVAPAAGHAPLGPEALIAVAQARGAGPGASIAFPVAPDLPVRVSTGRRAFFLLDPTTGTVLEGAGEVARDVFGRAEALHRSLALAGPDRATGQAITGAANLAFLFLLVSGVVLWWPHVWRWAMIRPKLMPRWRLATAKARDWNWHHAFGAWAVLPLLAIVVSGVVLSYPWASALVYRLHAEDVPQRRGPPGGDLARVAAPPLSGPPLGADAVLDAARAAVPGARILSLTIPTPGAPTAQVVVESGAGAQPAPRTTLLLSRADGTVLARRESTEVSAAQRMRGFLRYLHTGEAFGILGQTVAGLACLATLVLGWTGLALAWRRLVAPLQARRRSARAIGAGYGSTPP